MGHSIKSLTVPLNGKRLENGVEDLSKEDRVVFNAANTARDHAWSHYTNHKVAAGIRADNGRIYVGVNIECAVATDGQTASRCAIGNMVTAGARGFEVWILIGQGPSTCMPAGSDLQMAVEFATDDTVIACSNEDGSDITLWRLRELLPQAFDFKNLVSGRPAFD